MAGRGSGRNQNVRQLPPLPGGPQPRPRIPPMGSYTAMLNTPVCPDTEAALAAINTPYPEFTGYSQSGYSQDNEETQLPDDYGFFSQPVPTSQGPENIHNTPEAAEGSSPSMQTPQVSTRPLKSPVWNTFIRGALNEDGTRKATCKLCGHEFQLAAGTRAGTGQMLRHIKSVHPEVAERDLSAGSSTGGNYEYNHDVAREAMARYIPTQRQPFNFAAQKEFIRLVQIAFNPAYNGIPPTTVKRDITKMYRTRRDSLVSMFSTLNSRVCFTSDSWTSSNGLSVVCVTAHWIGEDWKLQKRIICFRSVQYSLTREALANLMVGCVTHHSLAEKVLSFTYDNARNFTGTIERLISSFGDEINEGIIHQRCICHTFQLIVRNGLEVYRPEIDFVRSIVQYITRANKTKNLWRHSCNVCGMPKKMLKREVSTRWNTTLHMLKSLVEYRHVLATFCTSVPQSMRHSFYIPNEFYEELTLLIEFLEFFEKWTTSFSGSYYPTSHLGVMALAWMIMHVTQPKYQESEKMKQCVIYVLAKFKKYYILIPRAFIIAQFFDPQMKYSYLLEAMDKIYKTFPEMGMDASTEFNKAEKDFEERYRVYEAKFGRQTGAQQQSSSSSSKAQFLRMLRPQAGSSSSRASSDYNRYKTMAPVPDEENGQPAK